MEWFDWVREWFNWGQQVLHQLSPEAIEKFVAAYGSWLYLLAFAIVFCETGLVVTPFLPGDSLLFAIGTVCGPHWDFVVEDPTQRPLSLYWMFLLLSAAAILGDTVNYWIGAYIGPRAFSGNIRFLKKEYLDRTHRFFEKYGGKTIILARFVPIVRTFAPFVAGIGAMNYAKFLAYNVIGGVVWVGLFLAGGWLLRDIEPFKSNFSLVALAIIFVSVLPILYEFWRARQERKGRK